MRKDEIPQTHQFQRESKGGVKNAIILCLCKR